jgi:hypothetical protein
VPTVAAAISRRVGVRTHVPQAPLAAVIQGNAAVLAGAAHGYQGSTALTAPR